MRTTFVYMCLPIWPSNNTLNFDHSMTIGTHGNTFLHLLRDPVRIHSKPDCFGYAELLTLWIPMMELNTTRISQAAMGAFDWFLTFIDEINRCFPALFIPFRFSEHHSALSHSPLLFAVIGIHSTVLLQRPDRFLSICRVFGPVSRRRYFVDSCAGG